MPKLTDSQLVILTAAAQRADGTVLPFPKTLKVNKGALTMVLRSLLKSKLVSERPAQRDEPHWREDGNHKLTLVITESGLTAAGFESVQPPEPKPAPPVAGRGKTKSNPPKTDKKRAPGSKTGTTATKQDLLIDLLKRKGGATIEEVVKATGWQPHSVRGAISGTLKKKLGLRIASEKTGDRGRVYRIAASN